VSWRAVQMEFKEINTLRLNKVSSYRPDIDGMRALAVLSVVIFHAFPNLVKGGFIGVDIFFVISGYLISGIIFRGLDENRFSFASFYSHRIKRIFPALIVVLAFVLVAGWFLLLPDEFRQLGKHMAASVVYLQNYALAGESGYFDVASELKPLTHMWSLAIEEQFYLLFPILAVCAWRVGLNLLALIVVALAASFYVNIHGVKLNPSIVYYLPQIRFWELLAGSVLAYVDLYKRNLVLETLEKIVFCRIFFSRPPEPIRQKKILCNLISAAGLALIVVSLYVIERGFSFPGWWGIGPVVGAFLVIFGGPGTLVNSAILSNRFMVFIGLISYPLYLWHWPLLSFAQIVSAGDAPVLVRATLVLASVVLAWLTYRFIERPIRTGQGGAMKVSALVFSSFVLGTVGYYSYAKNGFPNRLEEFSKVTKAAGEWDYPGRLTPTSFGAINYGVQQSSIAKTTLFVGDSNIEQYYPRVEALINALPGSVGTAIFKTGGGCLPVTGQKYDDGHSHCRDMMRDVVALANSKPEIDRVVIGAQWNGYLTSGFGLAQPIHLGDAAYERALESLSGFIKEMVSSGKKVYLVANIPTGKEVDPKYIARRDVLSFPNVFTLRSGGISKADLDKKYGKIRADLKRVGLESGAIVIDPVDYLCGDRCESLDDSGSPIYKDISHLRPSFVRAQVEFLDQTIQRYPSSHGYASPVMQR
jgi:peptidoglycan/LPS O-acetylase OafA/YrhL